MRAEGAAATSSPLVVAALESMWLGPVPESLIDPCKRSVKVPADAEPSPRDGHMREPGGSTRGRERLGIGAGQQGRTTSDGEGESRGRSLFT